MFETFFTGFLFGLGIAGVIGLIVFVISIIEKFKEVRRLERLVDEYSDALTKAYQSQSKKKSSKA